MKYLSTAIKLAIGITIIMWLWNSIFKDNEKDLFIKELRNRLKL